MFGPLWPDNARQYCNQRNKNLRKHTEPLGVPLVWLWSLLGKSPTIFVEYVSFLGYISRKVTVENSHVSSENAKVWRCPWWGNCRCRIDSMMQKNTTDMAIIKERNLDTGNYRFVVDVVDFKVKFFDVLHLVRFLCVSGCSGWYRPHLWVKQWRHQIARMIPPWFRVKRLAWRSCKGKLLSQKAVGKPSAPLQSSKHPNVFLGDIPKKHGFFSVWNSWQKIYETYKVRSFFLQFVPFTTFAWNLWSTLATAISWVLRWWHPRFPETIALTLA